MVCAEGELTTSVTCSIASLDEDLQRQLSSRSFPGCLTSGEIWNCSLSLQASTSFSIDPSGLNPHPRWFPSTSVPDPRRSSILPRGPDDASPCYPVPARVHQIRRSWFA